MVPVAAGLRHRYHDLALPIALVAGSEDQVVSISRHSVRLHHEIPGSSLRVIAGAGHMVHHAAPEEVAQAVEDLTSQQLLAAPRTGIQ
jgi:pimeloyl-ACP methyl ester carboxylesterase